MVDLKMSPVLSGFLDCLITLSGFLKERVCWGRRWLGGTSALLLPGLHWVSRNASLPLNNPSISKSTRRLYGKPNTSLLSQGRSHLLGRAPGSPCRAFWFFQAARKPPQPSTPSPWGFSHSPFPLSPANFYYNPQDTNLH